MVALSLFTVVLVFISVCMMMFLNNTNSELRKQILKKDIQIGKLKGDLEFQEDLYKSMVEKNGILTKENGEKDQTLSFLRNSSTGYLTKLELIQKVLDEGKIE